MRIAILMTTYNRKEKTIACLKSIQSQHLDDGIQLSIFLTDDASGDGTANAVKMAFPAVNVLAGTGSLFWAGGMRNSWKAALKENFDYYLLVNDDTILKSTAIEELISNAKKTEVLLQSPTINIGSTVDFETGELSYGGRKLQSKYSVKSTAVFSEKSTLECDLGNANIMLVPAAVVEKIGILSDHFTHGIADYDYTLKAKKSGFKVLVIPGITGKCSDDHGSNWMPQKAKLSDRIKYLKSPKGLAYHEYLHFIKDHFPGYYPVAFVKLWMKTLFPFIWQTFKA